MYTLYVHTLWYIINEDNNFTLPETDKKIRKKKILLEELFYFETTIYTLKKYQLHYTKKTNKTKL